MRTRRFRISLSNALLLTAIFALALGLWSVYRELASLRKLRSRGVLYVSDSSRVHVLPIPSFGEVGTWRWHIYIPEDVQAKVYARFNELPLVWTPAAGDSETRPFQMPVGESVLSCYVRGKEVFFNVYHDHGYFMVSNSIPDSAIIDDKTLQENLDDLGETRVKEEDRPLLLIKYGNPEYENGRHVVTGKSRDGVAVWIDTE